MSPPSEPKRTRRSADGAGDAAGELVRRALAEDAVADDITTRATVPMEAFGHARLIAREPCVVAGLNEFEACMIEAGSALKVVRGARDGDRVEPGAVLATVEGSLRAILAAERVALNFVQHLSGVATLTRAFADAAGGTAVLDTRKTTPGLRALEKAAVRAGGGRNHRADLASAVLIKDNHVTAAGGIARAIERARRIAGDQQIEIECDTLEQVSEALDAGAERLLLDNMDVEAVRKAVALVDGRAWVEASGGITLDTVGAIAGTGVDAVSVGALTHSARAIDLALELEEA